MKVEWGLIVNYANFVKKEPSTLYGQKGHLEWIPDDPQPVSKTDEFKKSACCGCIAGEPHKEKTDSCKSIFNNIIVTLGMMTTADFIEPHPASQVIEKGFFCSKCGMQVQNDSKDHFAPCRTFKGINY